MPNKKRADTPLSPIERVLKIQQQRALAEQLGKPKRPSKIPIFSEEEFRRFAEWLLMIFPDRGPGSAATDSERLRHALKVEVRSQILEELSRVIVKPGQEGAPQE